MKDDNQKKYTAVPGESIQILSSRLYQFLYDVKQKPLEISILIAQLLYEMSL